MRSVSRDRIRRLALTVGLATKTVVVLLFGVAPDADPLLTGAALVLGLTLVALAWVPRARPLLDSVDWLLFAPVALLFVAATGGAGSPHRITWLAVAIYAAAFLPTAWFRVALPVTIAGFVAPLLYDAPTSTEVRDHLIELFVFGVAILIVRLLVERMLRYAAEAGHRGASVDTLFEGNPMPMMLIDPDGTIERVNTSARVLVPQLGESVGLRLPTLDDMPTERLEAAIASALAGGVEVQDLDIRVGEEVRRLQATFVPTTDEVRPRVFVMARDVTGEHEARAALVRHTEQQASLAELGLEAVRGTSTDELLARAAALVARSLPSDNCSVVVPDGDGLVIRAIEGPEAERWSGRRLPLDGSMAGHVFTSGQPLLASDFRAETRFKVPEWLLDAPARSGLAVIIHTARGRWGVLAASCNEPRDWTEDDLSFVQTVANVIGAVITRRRVERQLAASEERFRRMADNAQDIVYRVELEPSIRVSYISPSVSDVLGYPPEDWLANPRLFSRLLDAELMAETMPEGREPVDVATTERLPFRSRDGELVWLEIRRAPIHDELGHVVAIDGISRDITAQQRSQRLLQEALEQEHRIASELRRVDEMKDNFMAAVSHELRTPLASVLGFALTLDHSRSRMTEEQLEVIVTRLSSNARKLDRLLSDLLDLDRMRRSVLEPTLRRVSLDDLVERVIASMGVEGRRLILDMPVVTGEVDPPMIERIVENLVGNALKHTGPDRTVWVRLEGGDDEIVLTVEDDGPGVPMELRAAIFEPFEQGPHDHPHAPGTGIGLSLVARFAELHGGVASVGERPGGGASFEVRLPRAREGAAPTSS